MTSPAGCTSRRSRAGSPAGEHARAFRSTRRTPSPSGSACNSPAGPKPAAELLKALGADYDSAIALVPTSDRTLLHTAHEQLRALGASPAAGIVARRLRELGERNLPRGPRAATRENPAGLTNRELEMLALLAQGLRNAQVAQRLVVSPKTVDHHVSSILRKLGVTNRAQAAAAAARLGVVVTDTDTNPPTGADRSLSQGR